MKDKKINFTFTILETAGGFWINGMAVLRLQGHQNLSGVAYAIFELSGKLSVVPTNQSRPVQSSDMATVTNPVRLNFSIIMDGKLKEQNLVFSKKGKNWLNGG